MPVGESSRIRSVLTCMSALPSLLPGGLLLLFSMGDAFLFVTGGLTGSHGFVTLLNVRWIAATWLRTSVCLGLGLAVAVAYGMVVAYVAGAPEDADIPGGILVLPIPVVLVALLVVGVMCGVGKRRGRRVGDVR